MKRAIAVLLALCILLSSASAFAQVTTKWDTSLVYKNADELYKEADDVMAQIPRLLDFRGNLSDPAVMLQYMDLTYSLDTRIKKMYNYTQMLSSLDVTSASAMQMEARVLAVNTAYVQAEAYVMPELGAMSAEERKTLIEDPQLSAYRYTLNFLMEESVHYLSEEQSGAISALSDVLDISGQVFELLAYSAIPAAQYDDPDGYTYSLDNYTFSYYMYSPEVTREQKTAVFGAMLGQYTNYLDVMAKLLDTHVRTVWDQSKLYIWDSSMQYALQADDIDPEIYDKLIEKGHEGIPLFQRYLSITKEKLGVDTLYDFDLAVDRSEFYNQKTYSRTVKDVKDALAVLGDEYSELLSTLYDTGHVDAFPSANKDTGAFSTTVCSDGELPFILLNFTVGDDGSTIAHESGHAMYSAMSGKNQPVQYQTPIIFTQEITSTTNEILYYVYMYQNAATDAEREYYLQAQIDMFSDTFFSQLMTAEFEAFMYEMVEEGDVLTSDVLKAKWAALWNKYYGAQITNSAHYDERWASIPHLYFTYYVYQYATSVCYAATIASRILEGDEATRESYLTFLKSGSSASPVDLLKELGIDPLSDEPYDAAFDYFSALLDIYEGQK